MHFLSKAVGDAVESEHRLFILGISRDPGACARRPLLQTPAFADFPRDASGRHRSSNAEILCWKVGVFTALGEKPSLGDVLQGNTRS